MFGKLFSRGTKATKTILLVDVTSGSVAAALGRLNKEGQPSLLFAKRQELPLKLTRSGEEMAQDTLAAIRQVTVEVRTIAGQWNEGGVVSPLTIDHVACFLSAPWSTTSVRALRLSRTKPFIMSAEVLRRMLSDELRAAETTMHEESQVLERAALALNLNGYRSEVISSAPVLTAEVTLVTTLSQKQVFKEIDQALGMFGPETEKTFHSFSVPSAYALMTVSPRLEDAIILSVSAEMTEALIVKAGSPAGRVVFPIGSHVLMRTLKSHAGMGRSESESALTLAQLEGTRLNNDMRDTLLMAAKEWRTAFESSLESLTGLGIPHAAYLFAEPATAGWFLESLAEPLTRVGHTAPIAATIVTGQLLSNAVNLTSAAFDASLAAELIYADARFDEGTALSLLSTREPLLNRSHARMSVSTEPAATVSVSATK